MLTVPTRSVIMTINLMILGATLTACSTPEANTSTIRSSEDEIVPALSPEADAINPCNSYFSFDLSADFDDGFATPEQALQAWLDGKTSGYGVAPDSAPRTGWVRSDTKTPGESLLTAGDWIARAWQSTHGDWLIISQTCQEN